jgi:hypothetical protein
MAMATRFRPLLVKLRIGPGGMLRPKQDDFQTPLQDVTYVHLPVLGILVLRRKLGSNFGSRVHL